MKGLELPGYEPRTLHSMALGLAVNARGADHNRSGAYEADLSGELDRLEGGSPHVVAAIETEDRAAVMDSLIFCKFLRGVFEDPFPEWARLLGSVTGWDVDGPELEATARRIVLAKRAFNAREGWTRSDDGLPERLLTETLEVSSGREAVLTRERLDGMIAGYYKARGLDGYVSRPIPAELPWPSPPHQPRSAPSVSRSTAGPDGPGRHDDLHAAKDAGIEIPVLCHDERYDPVGVCRLCVVDVGARVFAASCVRPCEDGMEVKTATPQLERSAQLTELLLVDQPPIAEDPKETTTADNELLVLVRRYGVQQEETPVPRAAAAARTTPTRSSPSTTTRASSAIAASARATTSRATTSSAASSRATTRASPSTSTTRWASRPA